MFDQVKNKVQTVLQQLQSSDQPGMEETSPLVDELELFLKDVENCREKLNEYNENLDEIEKQQKNILKVDWNAVARTAKTEVVEDLKNKNSVLQQEIAKMIKKGYNTSLESQKQEIQKMQLESLKESFQESLTRATNMFEEHKEKSKKCLIKSCQIAGIKLSEEQIEEKIAKNDLDLYSQGIIDQAKKELDDTKKRHNEVLSLEESIRELLELFKQMEELVEIQGHTVDNIENNVGRAQIDVEKGVKDLAEAAINQTSARKKKIGLIALGVFVFFFIIIIIISTQAGGDSRINGVQPIVVIIKNNETGKVEIIESCDPMEDNCV